MADARQNIIVAGAGIGGLAAALCLAARGFRVTVIDQAERLEEVGAGIQLPPNATRILLALGLGERLKDRIVVPEALSVTAARSGREIVRMPLGERSAFKYGAPYWLVHRGDLQAALLEAATANRAVTVKLGLRVEDFATHGKGLTVQSRRGRVAFDDRGGALVGADGLWSAVRARLGDDSAPQFCGRTAWRATVPADAAGTDVRAPVVRLWLGRDAHLVHYPVRGGSLINVVAIVADRWQGREWSAPGARAELLARFPVRRWAAGARALLEMPERWLKWSLCDRPPLARWGRGPVTLLGDAAHPMLPFLAQGAAMAIEDAAVLADCLARWTNDPTRALQQYEALRRPRTARVQRAARTVGRSYHLAPPASLARNVALRLMGGENLRMRYDWLYDWRPG